MAWSASGLMVAAHIDKWDDSQLATDLTSETDLKAAFFGVAVTPNFGTDTAYNAGTWATANESSGAGYTAGGVLVVNTTLTHASGSMKFDGDNFSIPDSTIIAEGYLLYDDAHADRALAAVWFGEDFETQDGTFLVTHDSLGIFLLDLTP
jgi:hypothetical protein